MDKRTMQFADCEYGSAQYFFLVSDNTIKNTLHGILKNIMQDLSNKRILRVTLQCDKPKS